MTHCLCDEQFVLSCSKFLSWQQVSNVFIIWQDGQMNEWAHTCTVWGTCLLSYYRAVIYMQVVSTLKGTDLACDTSSPHEINTVVSFINMLAKFTVKSRQNLCLDGHYDNFDVPCFNGIKLVWIYCNYLKAHGWGGVK